MQQPALLFVFSSCSVAGAGGWVVNGRVADEEELRDAASSLLPCPLWGTDTAAQNDKCKAGHVNLSLQGCSWLSELQAWVCFLSCLGMAARIDFSEQGPR